MESENPKGPSPADIAIIGMACLFPDAPDLTTYWHNILHGVDAITDPPGESWDPELFYDPDDGDRLYCKKGGFLGPQATFNPLEHGIMPRGLEGGDPDQWLTLKVARDALIDAGYLERLEASEAERRRTAVVLGKGTYLNRGNLNMLQHSLVIDQTLRILSTLHPEHGTEELETLRAHLKAQLPPFDAESAPGLVPNIIASRIANRLDLMGPTYTVDAACASSLIAVDIAVANLVSGQCDLALAGGSHVTTPIPILMLFSHLNALSRGERIRPFDAGADGTILGEGIGVLVLKRLADAERDGDPIYAVIKGVGTSSDGRAKGVLAPRPEGARLAVRRAYDASGIDPETVGLIEAHGTATTAGDLSEITALQPLWPAHPGRPPYCAIGSVKSMIGHTMAAAGVAGLIKAALALRHGTLPPTLNVDEPSPRLPWSETGLYVNTTSRPWFHHLDTPRRAAVNAFGFGGINAHVVLEEYRPVGDARAFPAGGQLRHWDSELIVLEAPDAAGLLATCDEIIAYLDSQPRVDLVDLAFTLNRRLVGLPARVGLVATSLEDLAAKLGRARKALADGKTRLRDTNNGLYYFAESFLPEGKLAFLFPGEGSQYPGMLADLAQHFPVVRACYDRIDRLYAGHPRGYVPSDVIFPRPFDETLGDNALGARLWQIDEAIEAVLTANQALFALLQQLGLQPDVIAGHSTGEYSALRAAGMVDLDDTAFIESLLDVSRRYDRVAREEAVPSYTLLAIGAGRAKVEGLLEQLDEPLFVGMDNCPHQTVVAGSRAAADAAIALMREKGVIFEELPFDRAYHTPLFGPFEATLREFFARLPILPPRIPTYSATTAGPFPDDPAEIRRIAVRHWVDTVRFTELISAMHEDGVRLFVEIGGRGNLNAFIGDILRGKPHQAMPANLQGRSGIRQLNNLLALLAAQGVPMKLDALYAERRTHVLALEPGESSNAPSAGTMRLQTDWALMTVDPALARQLAGAAGEARESAASRTAAAGPAGNGHHVATPGPRGASETGAGPKPAPTRAPDTPSARETTTPSPSAPVASPPVASAASMAPATRPTPSEPAPLGAGSTAPVPPDASGGAAAVMSAHLALMSQFLQAQEEVLRQLMSRGTAPSAPASPRPSAPANTRATPSPPAAPAMPSPGVPSPAVPGPGSVSLDLPPLPFVRQIERLVPGREAVVVCTLDRERDTFLHHHTLGRDISVTDPTLLGLPVVPFTVSMEMLAEAAAVLMPGKLLTGMKDVRGYRWVTVENPTLTLRLLANKKPGAPEVDVRLHLADGEPGSHIKMPLIEGTMVFGDVYPHAPAPAPLNLVDEHPSRWNPDNIYTEGLFHGTDFRAIAGVTRTGSNGLEVVLQALPRDHHFADREPNYLTDPAILDAAGQAIGLWTMENLEEGFIIFPYRLGEIRFYRPPLRFPEQATFRAVIRLSDDGRTFSDIDILDPGGQLWMQLFSWEDKRFFGLTWHFYRFELNPPQNMLTLPWERPPASMPADDPIVVVRVPSFPEGFFEGSHFLWGRVLANLVLNREERSFWYSMTGPAKRRTEWLLGRAAAKGAVRFLLRRRHGLVRAPADIPIAHDGARQPIAQGDWQEIVQQPVAVSITHADGTAAAAAGHVDGIGIDMEPVDRDVSAIMEHAFSAEERAWLDRMPADGQWPLRLWCAKEAVGKAVGLGLAQGPLSFVLADGDEGQGQQGQLRLVPSARMLSTYPELSGSVLLAHTGRDRRYIIAVAAV